MFIILIQEIQSYGVEAVCSGKIFVPGFVKVGKTVQNLKTKDDINNTGPS
jgi:hypothetical protein